MVQVLFAGIVPPASAKVLPPTAAAGVIVPPQLFVKLSGVANCIVPGKVSLRLMPAIAIAFVFEMVIVTVDVPPLLMLVGAKTFVADGGVAVTSRLTDGAPVPAVGTSVVVTPVVVFGYDPATTLVTTTVMVHEPFCGIVAFVTWIVLLPAIVVPEKVTPVQVPPVVSGLATVTSAFKVSVKFTPVSGIAFVLPSVNVSVEFVPTEIGLGANAFAMEAETPVTESVLFAPVPATGVCVAVAPDTVFG